MNLTGNSRASSHISSASSGSGQLSLADVLANHSSGETAGAGNAVVAQASVVLDAQDLNDLLLGSPSSWHPHFLVMKNKGMPNKVEEFQLVGSDSRRT